MSSRNRAIVRFDSNSGESGQQSDQSSNSSSNRRRNVEERDDEELNDQQLDRIVSDGVKYVLICDQKKLPIKRSDLFKAVLKNISHYKDLRKTNERIIEKIKSSLVKAFALELTECPDITPISYILVNKLSIDGINESVDCDSIPEQQHYRSALLTTVLSLIFMSGQTIHEDIMWRFLTKLGFDVNSKQQTLQLNNELNGITIKKLLTDLWVKQLYLKYQKIPRSDPIVHEFKWGFRSDQEFNKIDLIKFVCNVYGDNSEPNYWRNQYQIAVNQQNSGDVEEEQDIDVIDE